MIEELGRHGYRIRSGSLYPLPGSLEKNGYLRGKGQREGDQVVRRATDEIREGSLLR